MLPIDFDRLAVEYSEYATEWSVLREWFSRNSRKHYVELTVLSRALKDRISPLGLVKALRMMIASEMLAVAYRVRAPGGYLLEDEFDEPDQIENEIWDRDGSRKIPTDEAELVSGYRWEKVNAA